MHQQRASPPVCLILLLLLGSQSFVVAQCPGVVAGTCTLACQRYVCNALVRVYNVSQPPPRDAEPGGWTNRTGWADAVGDGCADILGTGSSPPKYCGWYGVDCCSSTPGASCPFDGAVTNVTLQTNRLNVSASNPDFLRSITELNECQLQGLDLSGNDLSGQLSPDWGKLSNLRQLQLSNQWLDGPLPSELGQLSNLQTLKLDANFFSGTLPPQLGNLTQLRVLNLAGAKGKCMQEPKTAGPKHTQLSRVYMTTSEGRSCEQQYQQPCCGHVT